MPIKKIESVYINGNNTAFGGNIFNVNWEPQLYDNPSRLNVILVSENGEYLKPELSYKIPYRIKIGNDINLNYYLIAYELRESTEGGNVLSVTFVDESHILDKRLVVLHKKHRDKNVHNYKNSCFIVVGKEIHPCDVNFDGNFNSVDAKKLKNPCDIICPGQESDNIDCFNISNSVIFDVHYNFRELLEAIERNGIKIGSKPQEINDFYHARHFGTLREVLQNWCGTFGYVFYWENNTLNFIDASSPIEIDTSFLDDNSSILEKVSRETLEDTFSNTYISYYGQAGEKLETSCNKTQAVNCRCLNLADLFVEDSRQILDLGGSTPSRANIKYELYNTPIWVLEACCTLVRYDQVFRDSFLWFDYYDCKDSSKIKNLQGLKLNPLGNMRIIKGINNQDIEYNKLVNLYLDFVFGEESPDNVNLRRDLREKVISPDKDIYFFIAEIDEDKYKDYIEAEYELANNFIGRYFFKNFYLSESEAQTANVSNGTYFARGASWESTPFARFNPIPDSAIDKLRFQRNYTEAEQSANSNIRSAREENDQRSKTGASFIVVQKEAVWHPNDTEENMKAAAKVLTESLFQEMDGGSSLKFLNETFVKQNDGLGVSEEDVENYKKNPEKFKLFFCFKSPIKDGISVSVGVDHPADESPQKTYIDGIANTIEYGLMSKKTVDYKFFNIIFHTPSWGSVYMNTSLDGAGLGDVAGVYSAAYKVLVTYQDQKTRYIPKIESNFAQDEIFCNENVSNIKLEARDISRDDFELITSNSICSPNESLIGEIHEKFNENLDYSLDKPFISKTFVVAGINIDNIPRNLITNGLESLDISIGENGVESVWTFSNKLFIPPERDFLMSKIEFLNNSSINNSKNVHYKYNKK
ncbi:MAG: hypothetical protein HC836_12620 [Richelia sp. RM2_1_2]|nr:hypothetical protein [Richelia sp. RM2_1_2]